MSVFKELSHWRAEYNAARMEQLNRLSDRAQRLVGALQNYLGLDSPHWVNPKDGVVMNYVRMGSGSPQHFEEKGRHELSSIDGVMAFSVAITLENAPDQYPKTHHVFQLEVIARQGGYEFSSRDFDGSFLVGATEEADHAYEGVCTAIVNELKKSYDVGRVF
ncbi:hypothetical protein KC131_26190 [Pseudomonas sp. JQ170]|uniref:hypothetical protein n=1 Tax=unclassified Pseudomonas TaxID=196821 RepID=UPI00264A6196|nr:MULTISPECIES: hypothetical protein [unclassified Pseudomonas]MDN7144141.1 hypothetical protein [Pseudomonas sp. JQ170]WRO77740.1 hypothetical protein U9R80_08700 [Pseudomonas sp. 170C]